MKNFVYSLLNPVFSDPMAEPEAWIVASESCAFLSIGAKFVREVLPGEIIELTRRGVQTVSIVERPGNSPPAFCIFEYVYFARADSIFEGIFATVHRRIYVAIKYDYG